MSVSVVIPAVEPCPALPALLTSLTTAAARTAGIEQVVVVDNSAEGSSCIERAVAAAHETSGACPTVERVHEPVRGSYRARNTGIRMTSGEWIAFLDADLTPAASWFDAVAELTVDGMILRATGPVTQVVTHRATRFLDRCAQSLDMAVGINQRAYAAGGWAATANLLVRRSLFDDVGFFEGRLESSGDREFGRRCFRVGYAITFDERLEVRHEARATLGALIGKAERVSRGLAQLLQLLGTAGYRELFGSELSRWWPLDNRLRYAAKLLLGKAAPELRFRDRAMAALVAPIVGFRGFWELRQSLRRHPPSLNGTPPTPV